MKKTSKKIKVLCLGIILTFISIICIILNGKTYTVKLDVENEISSINELNIEIEQEKEFVKCIDKKLEDGVLELKFKSVNEGKAWIDIKNENYSKFFSIYVHKFGIITYNDFFGDSNGGIIIPISLTICLVYIWYLFVKSYSKNIRENMYMYKNITYLGLIIFLSFTIFNQILAIFNYKGFIDTVEQIIELCLIFSHVLLPFAFFVSIFVTISNFVLMKKEGVNWRYLLGLMLGVFFCFMTIFPNILSDILQSSSWIDVHNEQGIILYIEKFFDTVIYVIVSYFECTLLGTIILGIKAAKQIPKFDKDFILILGCKIKIDGTVTNLLKGRVDRAIEFRNMQKQSTGKDLIFVPSGGQGEDEIISEAQAMKNYLIEKGISEENILIEDKSKNTFENIKFSNKIINDYANNCDIKKNPQIAFSTTNYHVFRAGNIACNQNINIEGIGAKTKSYFWLNAFIREFIATLYSEKKKHIVIISNIFVVVIFMITILYLSNSI